MSLLAMFRSREQEADHLRGSGRDGQATAYQRVDRSAARSGNTRSRRVDAGATAAYDEEKRRARRRLIGAVALLLVAILIVPMVMDDEPKPLGDEVNLIVPPRDTAHALRDTLPRDMARGLARDMPSQAQTAATSGLAMPALVQKSAPTNPPATSSSASKASLEPRQAAKTDVKPDVSSAPATAAVSKSKTTVQPQSSSSTPAKSEKVTPISGGYWVQVGAFATDGKAANMHNALVNKGFPVVKETIETPHGAVVRVRVGPYGDRNAASKAKEQLAKAGFSGALVQ